MEFEAGRGAYNAGRVLGALFSIALFSTILHFIINWFHGGHWGPLSTAGTVLSILALGFILQRLLK